MSGVFKKSLGEMLLEHGIVEKAMLDEAVAIQQKSGKKLGKILQEKGYLSEETLYSFLERQIGVHFLSAIEEEPNKEVFRYLSMRYCRDKVIAPVKMTNRSVKVYISEPTNTAMINEISFMTGKVVEINYAMEGAILEFLDRAAEGGGAYSREAVKQKTKKKEETVEEMNEDDSPVVRFVDETIQNAVDRNASDIHFESYEKRAFLRLRVDGVLSKPDEVDPRIYPAIISRIKILSELDISEKRLPQDGRIMMTFQDRKIDIRVSVIPTVHGENAVLRILDKGRKALTLTDIGIPKSFLTDLEREAVKPYGMVLVTGPTGSGKTTTLYAVLQRILQGGEPKVLTIEDPVEYQVDGVSQVQVHAEIGLTFAAGLRAFLRHDPDVIMVGEIRDLETAEIAVRAALTGHLVLSTVHTNDAASTLTRFVDMGIPPYLLTSTINLVMAQRLVRRICPKCKTEHALTAEEIKVFDIADYFKPKDVVYSGKGCKACGGAGYSGRIPVFEMMKMTEDIKKAVLTGASSFEIKDRAVNGGMIPLRGEGLLLVKEGVTTLDEIQKIVSLGE